MTFLSTVFWSAFYLFTSLLLLYYLYYKFFASRYWADKNVPHLPPKFLLGNLWNASITENFAFLFLDMYRKWKHHKVVGFWGFTTPFLLINDLDIIKNILIRDFNYFRDRGFDIDFDHDPLAGHLFNVGGAKWRNLRVKLAPTFTSGKMKMMFSTMLACGEELQDYLKKLAETKKEVEVKDMLARFTTDIIASCAFGIEANSLKNPNSEFRIYGKKFFDTSLPNLLRGLLFNISPQLFNLLKISFTPPEVTKFFLKTFNETFEYREKNKVKRKDFMELLIQLKNKGKLDDVDGVIPNIPDGDDTPSEDVKFTTNDAAAQAFVFFAAGFETSSTVLSFVLYELALDCGIRRELQEEIDRVVEKNGGKVTYEGVLEMEYLDWVVQETLRKYPPVSVIFRQCNKDYHIPELGITIPKKVSVMIPVMGIQKDPEFFPNPEKFDPKRYSPEEKAKRHHFTSLPFGEGPRSCIGNRFGLLQTKVGLISILSKFDVEVTNETPIPMKFSKSSIVLASESGLPLRFVPRIK